MISIAINIQQKQTLYYIDINECAGDHGCPQLCNNTDGSFNCYCSPGFLLNSNGTNCTGWLYNGYWLEEPFS